MLWPRSRQLIVLVGQHMAPVHGEVLEAHSAHDDSSGIPNLNMFTNDRFSLGTAKASCPVVPSSTIDRSQKPTLNFHVEEE
jgi:hypothetical protein